MTEPRDPMLWDVDQAAAELQLSKAHLYRLVSDKAIPFVRVGRLVRFQPDKVRAWLAEREVPAVTR